MLVHEMLEYTTARLPHKTALIEGDRRLTFCETLDQVVALAANLSEMGVSKGDRVALFFPNCIEFCIAYFAVLRLGAIVVPMNNRLAPREFAYIVNDCGTETMIVGYQSWETYQAFTSDLKEEMRLIYAGDKPVEGAEFFSDLIKPVQSAPESPVIEMDDPACIMYTSGTTGVPKGAVMSHRNIFTNARNAGAHMGYRERDVTLIVVPLFHVTGLNTQLVALIYVGGTTVIMRSYNTAGMIELLAEHKVTTMITVPTMYTLMTLNSALGKADLSSVRALSYGGAPMAPDTMIALQERLRGVDLFNAYGLTETSSLATAMPPCDTMRKGSSVGLPVSGVQLRVVDAEGGDLPPDTTGELWIRGPNVVASYWNKPEVTAKDLANGWLRTGDYARIDEEGFVYIVDRMKDMINRGGENIFCIEVEAVLVENQKVLEAAVVPRPHSIFGEVVHAFIVPVPGTEPTENEIIEYCVRELVPPGDPPRR
ncbi:MAG: AMP-binding protein [Deltaproteobacteria bacterium]|nr:AMP-binding protein [Deltaproteobacteria bacterium]